VFEPPFGGVIMCAVIRRLFAVTGLLVSVAGFAVFAGSAVGVWRVKAEANRQTEELAVKARFAVDEADRAVVFVSRVIDQADSDLREAARQPVVEAPVNPFLQLTARKASQNLAGSVDRANVAVATASDASVVAVAALQVFGDEEQFPELKAWLGVRPDQLAQTKDQLGRASTELNQVRTVLGVPLDGGPTAEQLAVVESALARARELTNQMSTVVSTARARVEETKQAIDRWVLRVALAVTVIGAVGALGQVFMARACWRALRGRTV
jgi:hypothetical protein